MFLSRKMICTAAAALAITFAPALAQQASAATTQSSQSPAAAQHAVSPAQLHKDVTASAAARQANIATLQKFFSTPEARQAMQKAGIDYKVVENAIPSLSSSELAQLASRANNAQQQFAAGAWSNHDLTIAVVAIAVVVLIIILVLI